MADNLEPTGPRAIHAPWRLQYLEELADREREMGEQAASSGSFLLDYWRDPAGDVPNHVVVRTGSGLVMLNRYPYANGHLLVTLGEARPRLLAYDADQRAALWRLVDLATDLLEKTLEPQGLNIGINQGRAGGAGVPHHLHVHVVPRWGGDVNFMSAVGNVRVIPSALDAMAERFRNTWSEIEGEW